MQGMSLVLKLDPYEAEAVRKVVGLIRNKTGKRIPPERFVTSCVRYTVHDLLPEDFMLGPDARDVLKDVRR